MIRYRPHRSLLTESMKLCMEFETVDDMLAYVQLEHPLCIISVAPECYTDERINWMHWHYVMASGYVAGMCDIP